MRSLATVVGLGALLLGSAAAAPPPGGKGLILLVRHAERAQAAMTEDPPLTDAGTARAERLAALLAESGIQAIFITRFQRTQATAKPLADRLRLTPIEESDTAQLIAKLKTRTDETVLVSPT
jgi:broad specificity phosphatase PhoE